MEIRKMSGPNENKPGKKKHGKGSRKAKPSLNQKPDQMLDEKPEPVQSHKLEQLASNEPEQLQSAKPEPCQAGNKQADPAIASGNALSVDFQTLATAYGNYTKKSFEQTQAFVEKLSGVRSLDKAVEIQTEFEIG